MIQVIKRPLITEKNATFNEQNAYVFEVHQKADKTQIKTAVEKAFRVHVVGVRTQICRGRVRRVGRSVSNVQYWKKAIVKIKAGEKIQLFEGV